MVRIAFAALLTLAVSVFAVGDPAGAANVGNGQGKQFITGGCTSDADCASACCAGLKDGAVCSAKDVANEQGKQGCGFGGAAAGGGGGGGKKQNGGNNAGNNGGNGGNAGNAGNNAAVPDAAGSQNVGNGQGKQFITGACTSDADCASGCCAGKGNGAVCSARAVANEQGKQGCGFGGGAAVGGGAGAGKKQNGGNNAGNAGNNAAVPDAAGSQNVGNGQGKQFITGACTSDADCASGCCAGKGNGAICSARAVANEQGKQGCGFGGAGAGGAVAKKDADNGAATNGADGQTGNGQLCAREWTA